MLSRVRTAHGSEVAVFLPKDAVIFSQKNNAMELFGHAEVPKLAEGAPLERE